MTQKFKIFKRKSYDDKIELTLSEYPKGEDLVLECYSMEEFFLKLNMIKSALLKVDGICIDRVLYAIEQYSQIGRISVNDGSSLIKINIE